MKSNLGCLKKYFSLGSSPIIIDLQFLYLFKILIIAVANLSKPFAKLSFPEKIIIFSMICGRAFSNETQIDLMDQALLDNWSKVLDISFTKLNSLGIIKLSKTNWEKTLYKKGTEHPVSVIIRHTDALPKKVNRIFKAPGKQKYYLEIMDNNELNVDKLSHLFKKVFEDKMDLTNLDDIIGHCKDVFIKNGNFLYHEGTPFSHPKYDLTLKEAAENVIFSL